MREARWPEAAARGAAGRLPVDMANIKSQIKRNKQNLVRNERNKAVRTSLKTSTKKVQSAIADGDADAAQASALEASRALDKAASKGIVHKRTAARRKSPAGQGRQHRRRRVNTRRSQATRASPRCGSDSRGQPTGDGGDQHRHDDVAFRRTSARSASVMRSCSPQLRHREVPRLLLVAPGLPVEPEPGLLRDLRG